MSSREYDFFIAGGGPAGLSTALALRHVLGNKPKIALADPVYGAPRPDLRTYAISPGPMRLLSRIGVWRRLMSVQPVCRMDITDSQLHDPIRPILLQFGDSARPDPLAWIVEHNDLMSALTSALQEAEIVTLTQSVQRLETKTNFIGISLDDGTRTSAGLLIACDGLNSRVRDLIRIPVTGWPYARTAIVATVESEIPNEGVAVQHFLPAGTFALLPLQDSRFSVVWVEKADDAAAFCSLPADLFLEEIQQRAGNEFGALKPLAGPQAFPLRLQIAQRFTDLRTVLIADAAHAMHPLAGQGLNLGLSDVAHLVEALKRQSLLGLDLGARSVLQRYESVRHLETTRMLAATDALFYLFTSDLSLARPARDFGLGIVDRSAKMKAALVGTTTAKSFAHAPLMDLLETS